MLLSNFFAGLRFVFDAARRFEVGNGGIEFSRGNPERRLDTAWSVLWSSNIELRGIDAAPGWRRETNGMRRNRSRQKKG